MAKRSPKPTVSDIIGRLRLAEQYWGTLHNEMQTDFNIVNNLQAISVPAGYNQLYTGTAASLIATAADHITGDVPKIQVPEANLSKQAQERSERLEKGLQAAQYQIDSAMNTDIRRAIVINGMWSGMYVSKGPIFQPESWGRIPTADGYKDETSFQTALDEYEATKKINWPIYRKPVDPRYVFPDPGTTGRQWVIVKYLREVGAIAAQWPGWNKKLSIVSDVYSGAYGPISQQGITSVGSGRSGLEGVLPDTYLVPWIEYWDEHYRAYMVGTQLIEGKVYEHGYGKPPFQIRSAGFGYDTGLPEERFRSLIYPARSLLNQQIAVLNQMDAIMRRTAWPIILQEIGNGLDELSPGKIKEVVDIEKVKMFTEFDPSIPAALENEMAFLDRQIQDATFPSIVRGINSTGIRSGYGVNSLIAEAKVKFGPPARALEALEAEFNQDLCRCVEHVITEPLPIWGVTRWGALDAKLNPDDIAGLRHIIVTVTPKLPQDRANELAIAQIALSLGLIDKDTAISDFLGYDQPGEMRQRILLDKIQDAPEFTRVAVLAAALESGYIQSIIDMAKQIGMDPGQLITTLGFGNPSQQASGPSVGGAPGNVASQFSGGPAALPSESQMGQPNKPQGVPGTGGFGMDQLQAAQRGQTPGTQTAVRNAAQPGLPIHTPSGFHA